ncbi:MAG: hypothetical protein HY902_07500 [Deltaproteobacteria bacterium]|nr:hypothetical protein [Deltaproteobacteria bacterium]
MIQRRNYAEERLAEERARVAMQAARARRLRWTVAAAGLVVVAGTAAALLSSANFGLGNALRATMAGAAKLLPQTSQPLVDLPPLPPRPPRPASGPEAYRTGQLDPKVQQIPPEIQQLSGGPALPYVQAVARFLTQGEADEFLKVKRLHDWVAATIAYDVDGLRGRSPRMTGLDEVLRSRRAVCQGYAAVFEALCKSAGIEARIIGGMGRSAPGDAWLTALGPDQAHAWNAVRIQGAWHLLDVTWDAGSTNDDVFEWGYTTDYLFLPPEAFLYTHLPDDPADQLVAQPITQVQFLARPFLRGEFYSAGLTLATPVEQVTGASSVEIRHCEDVRVWAELTDQGGKTRIKGQTLVAMAPGGVVVQVRPVLAPATLTISAGPSAGGPAAEVAEIRVAAGTAPPTPLAQVSSTLSRLRGQLAEPLDERLPTDKPVPFRVREPKVDGVSVESGGKWTPLARDGTSQVFAGEVILVAGPVRLYAHEKPDDPNWTVLAEYTASADP